MMFFTCIMFPQKQKNGTIYKEHPAITMVENMQQAFVAGDTIKVAGYLADDFKAFNGMNSNPDAKGTNKQQFVSSVKGWKNNIDYFSISRTKGAYPDAIEYDNDSGFWVQTWDQIKGVHKNTGVKIDMPMHRLYLVNKDNKISRIVTYDDASVWSEMRDAFNPRKNGIIYNQHENINTVRKMVVALEHGDADKAFSYFTDNAGFTNLDMPQGESNTLAQEKASFKAMLKDWTIDSIDVVGFPDYLEYESPKLKIVMSWWDARLTRKSDGKKVTLPLHLVHYINDDGKITSEIGYYTMSTLK